MRARIGNPRPGLDDFSPNQLTSRELREVGDNSENAYAVLLLGIQGPCALIRVSSH